MELRVNEQPILSDKQIEMFVDFGSSLARIHKRLMSVGFTVQNGELIPPDKKVSVIK